MDCELSLAASAERAGPLRRCTGHRPHRCRRSCDPRGCQGAGPRAARTRQGRGPQEALLPLLLVGYDRLAQGRGHPAQVADHQRAADGQLQPGADQVRREAGPLPAGRRREPGAAAVLPHLWPGDRASVRPAYVAKRSSADSPLSFTFYMGVTSIVIPRFKGIVPMLESCIKYKISIWFVAQRCRLRPLLMRRTGGLCRRRLFCCARTPVRRSSTPRSPRCVWSILRRMPPESDSRCRS